MSPPISETAPPASELPGESLTTLPDGESLLTAASVMSTAPPASELPGESLATLPDGESLLTAASVMSTAPPASELPGESLATLLDGESLLTAASVMSTAPPASELPGESLTTLPDSQETLHQPLAKEKGNYHVPKEIAAQIPKSLTGATLARRLGVSPGSISRNKMKDNFGQWTFQHDPDGVSWHFDGQTFRSVVSSPPE